MDVVTLVLAKQFAKKYSDDLIAGIGSRGIVYKGIVSYYSNLPSSPTVGDSYTVQYKGTSGTEPDGSQYVYSTYIQTGTSDWVKLPSGAVEKLYIIQVNDDGTSVKTQKVISEELTEMSNPVVVFVNNIGRQMFACIHSVKASTVSLQLIDAVGDSINGEIFRGRIITVNRQYETVLTNITFEPVSAQGIRNTLSMTETTMKSVLQDSSVYSQYTPYIVVCGEILTSEQHDPLYVVGNQYLLKRTTENTLTWEKISGELDLSEFTSAEITQLWNEVS